MYFTIREKLRFNPMVNKGLCLGQSLYRSHFGRLVDDLRRSPKAARAAKGAALRLRSREEGRSPAEWLEYHHAAGVDHFYLCDNCRAHNDREVADPWLKAGLATVVEWPKTPAYPFAKEDFIRQAPGRFARVGFLDADEFLVIRDRRSVGEFPEGFPKAPRGRAAMGDARVLHASPPAEGAGDRGLSAEGGEDQPACQIVHPAMAGGAMPELAFVVLLPGGRAGGRTRTAAVRQPQDGSHGGGCLDQPLLRQKRRGLSEKGGVTLHAGQGGSQLPDAADRKDGRRDEEERRGGRRERRRVLPGALCRDRTPRAAAEAGSGAEQRELTPATIPNSPVIWS